MASSSIPRIVLVALGACALAAPLRAQAPATCTDTLAPLVARVGAPSHGPRDDEAPGGAAASDDAPAARTVDDLVRLALECNPGLRAVRAAANAASAGVTTARAVPNPEVEVMPSRFRPRAGATPLGGAGTITGLSQRLELPQVRGARITAARAGAEAATLDVRAAEQSLAALVRTRFFDLQRRDEELAAARDDRQLTEQIRQRVRVAVSQGEAPRFDLLRADAEVAIAARAEERARARVAEGRALLRQAVGPALGAGFVVRGEFHAKHPAPDSAALLAAVLDRNPELRRAGAEERRAERQLAVERGLRWPAVGVRVMNEQEPEQRIVRGGVYVSLPVWDRRAGPVREAEATLERRRAEVEQRRFELARAFEAAWQQYQGAVQGVALLEGGALEDARAAVRVAEAAYRAGERPILELLDARRQLRTVRTELIAAQYELHVARAELDRLAALAPLPGSSDAR